jgi:hypothetical protein
MVADWVANYWCKYVLVEIQQPMIRIKIWDSIPKKSDMFLLFKNYHVVHCQSFNRYYNAGLYNIV